jgi:hypothetical protein
LDRFLNDARCHIIVYNEADRAGVFIIPATVEAPCEHCRQQHRTEQHGTDGSGAHVLERMFSFIKSTPLFFTHFFWFARMDYHDKRASVV